MASLEKFSATFLQLILEFEMNTQTVFLYVVVLGLFYVIGYLSVPKAYSPTAEQLLIDARRWCQYKLNCASMEWGEIQIFDQDLARIKNYVTFNPNRNSHGIYYDTLMLYAKSWHELPHERKQILFEKENSKSLLYI